MDYEEREILCHRIICGFKLIRERSQLYLVNDPTSIDLYFAEDYYQSVYDQLNFDGLLNEDLSKIILQNKGLLDQNVDHKLKDLQENLKKLRKRLPELEFRSVEKKEIMIYINITEKEIKKLQNLKYSLSYYTSEHIAKLEKYKYLLFRLTTDEEGNKIWKDFKVFKNIEDRLLNRLVTECYLDNSIDEKKIRELARTEPWRSIWIAATKVGNLFNKPMVEMTTYQKILVSWSLIYDSVYESMDSPSSEIINNDILLDAWLEAQQDKRNQDKTPDKMITNSRIANAQEVGIMVDSPEDADKVYKLNNTQALSVVKNREAILKKEGSIKEQQLPDVKRQLQMQLNNAFKDKVLKG